MCHVTSVLTGLANAWKLSVGFSVIEGGDSEVFGGMVEKFEESYD